MSGQFETSYVERRGQCRLCSNTGFVAVNKNWYCLDHLDVGLSVEVRAAAIEAGADPEDIEQQAWDALSDAVHRHLETLNEDDDE